MENRERMLDTLLPEEQKVQYDENDSAKLKSVAMLFTEAAMGTLEALGKYDEIAQMEADENSADLMKGARVDVIAAWTTVQAAVSKLAWTLRINGDEAYAAALAAAKGDTEADFSGM